MCATLSLDMDAAVAAYAAAVDDAIRAYASTLAEPCCRAKIVFLRPDGTEIVVHDVTPPEDDATDPDAETSNP